MKKIISVFLAFIFILPLTVFYSFDEDDESVNTIVQKTDTGITVNARSAVLMDASTGQVLFSANEHERLYPASVTKIMPLLLFMEALDEGRINLTDKVTASPVAHHR